MIVPRYAEMLLVRIRREVLHALIVVKLQSTQCVHESRCGYEERVTPIYAVVH